MWYKLGSEKTYEHGTEKEGKKTGGREKGGRREGKKEGKKEGEEGRKEESWLMLLLIICKNLYLGNPMCYDPDNYKLE